MYSNINQKFYLLLYKIIVFNFQFHKDRSYQIESNFKYIFNYIRIFNSIRFIVENISSKFSSSRWIWNLLLYVSNLFSSASGFELKIDGDFISVWLLYSLLLLIIGIPYFIINEIYIFNRLRHYLDFIFITILFNLKYVITLFFLHQLFIHKIKFLIVCTIHLSIYFT